MKIRAILVASLVALGSSSALGKPLLRSIFGGTAPPRPRGLISRVDPYQSHPPVPRARPTAALADKPEQVTIGVVTIRPSVAARAADPALAGSAPKTPNFPPAPCELAKKLGLGNVSFEQMDGQRHLRANAGRFQIITASLVMHEFLERRGARRPFEWRGNTSV